jgi:triosephosphate isomerase (TIM)
MRKLIVGNWKMNGLESDLAEVAAIGEGVAAFSAVDTALCVPATLIANASRVKGATQIGAQDCHAENAGAHTGCVSAAMLKEAGAQLTIVGHSERRAAQHESSDDICGKAKAAHASGLSVIICVGETESERMAGVAEAVVLDQLDKSVPGDAASDWLAIAYEPVWAIGTGRIPTLADVGKMHDTIRAALTARFSNNGASFRILYGGSMNGDNAAGLLAIPNVDGGLIGGASLSAAKFLPIVAAAQSVQ